MARTGSQSRLSDSLSLLERIKNNLDKNQLNYRFRPRNQGRFIRLPSVSMELAYGEVDTMA
jgi:hypothetical protein